MYCWLMLLLSVSVFLSSFNVDRYCYLVLCIIEVKGLSEVADTCVRIDFS